MLFAVTPISPGAHPTASGSLGFVIVAFTDGPFVVPSKSKGYQ